MNQTENIQEAFDVLVSPELAGTRWTWANGTFTTCQLTDQGGYDILSGSQTFSRELKLICQKADFPNGVPAKQSTVWQTAVPTVKYTVQKDNSTENSIDPTFILEVELKHPSV